MPGGLRCWVPDASPTCLEVEQEVTKMNSLRANGLRGRVTDMGPQMVEA